MSDIKIVNDQGVEVDSNKPINQEKSNTISYDGNLQIREIANMLGMEKDSELRKYKDELEVLVEYAKDKTEANEDINELKWAIRDLQNQLGSPPMGEKPIIQLARFSRLSLDSRNIKKKMIKMLGLESI